MNENRNNDADARKKKFVSIDDMYNSITTDKEFMAQLEPFGITARVLGGNDALTRSLYYGQYTELLPVRFVSDREEIQNVYDFLGEMKVSIRAIKKDGKFQNIEFQTPLNLMDCRKLSFCPWGSFAVEITGDALNNYQKYGTPLATMEFDLKDKHYAYVISRNPATNRPIVMPLASVKKMIEKQSFGLDKVKGVNLDKFAAGEKVSVKNYKLPFSNEEYTGDLYFDVAHRRPAPLRELTLAEKMLVGEEVIASIREEMKEERGQSAQIKR